KNPYDVGTGWGEEPWSQVEMPLDDDLVKKSAEKGDTAIVIIGRTAGEEQDVRYETGSFLLTELEKSMLVKVRREFKKVVVLLNVGGLIDINFIEDCKPDALLYVWQGGMTGGTGTAKVLSGEVSPSGKLTDTIAYNIEDYPSGQYFGGKDNNIYAEDIYVGYRYFDTFASEKIRYPFGYGLSYTTFETEFLYHEYEPEKDDTNVKIYIRITNTGEYSGKEVVMLYLEKPDGKLGQPKKILCGYEKTKTLAPNESQEICFEINLEEFASYDDSGVTGYKNCWVLEEGVYGFNSSSDDWGVAVKISGDRVIKECTQALAPVEPFERMANHSGLEFESVPLNEADESLRRFENMPEELEYTGDRGIKLADVYSGKNNMDEFIAQLNDEELSCIIRGEGMGSPRVTAGTASAFGGVSDSLTRYGIPAACCDDGPSGMRLDCGTKAFSLPNGTMIASTFNKELIENLFEFLGLEMSANKVDSLLGPGMNIHRHPLNGRNFEYFSEDPYLTGTMAAAELRGLHKSGVTGTIKHFCANNQETNRHFLDSVVSERALREIYLKGFEIAVKQGNADSIMTTYGKINGVWTAGNYDLNTIVLRNEWGYTGIVMTDWWADISEKNGKPDKSDFAKMTVAQNDLYMVCADGAENDDNTLESLSSGELKRSELQRNARNICNFLLHTNAFRRLIGEADEIEVINKAEEDISSDEPVNFYEIDNSFTLDLHEVKAVKGKDYSFALIVNNPAYYKMTVTASSTQG
ncbi:MAG: glycoside hydrolase family 3 C-terminal domain-containing protein, partial [Ruminococcus sp.]|nr:glycoside hydrolase family 3 C-terminal domain-containing protein [Ruminococcus sp.]